MIPGLEILEQGEETPGVVEHVEETHDVGEHEEETSVVENRLVPGNSNDLPSRNFRSGFVPFSRGPVVTISGRVSKPPKKYDMEY